MQEVIDHPNKGLTAVIAKNGVNDAKQIGKALDKFIFSGNNKIFGGINS